MSVEDLSHVDYDVRHSQQAKHPSIRVDLDGVEVVIPQDEDIEPIDVLQEKSEWVLRKVAETEERRTEIPRRDFSDGSTTQFLENQYEIRHEDRANSTHRDQILLLSQQRVEEKSAQYEAKRVLKRIFKAHAKPKVKELADQHNLSYNTLYIRDQKTKWGSCSSKDNISLNWRVGFAPLHVVHYILAHELAHLKHMNHSQAFWQTVQTLYPEYKEAKKWLDQYEHRLTLL